MTQWVGRWKYDQQMDDKRSEMGLDKIEEEIEKLEDRLKNEDPFNLLTKYQISKLKRRLNIYEDLKLEILKKRIPMKEFKDLPPKEMAATLISKLQNEIDGFIHLRQRIDEHYKSIIKLEAARIDTFENMQEYFTSLKTIKEVAFENHKRFKDQYEIMDEIFSAFVSKDEPILNPKKISVRRYLKLNKEDIKADKE